MAAIAAIHNLNAGRPPGKAHRARFSMKRIQLSLCPQQLYDLLRQRMGEYLTDLEVSQRLNCSLQSLTPAFASLAAGGVDVELDPSLGRRLTAIPRTLSSFEIGYDLRTATIGRGCVVRSCVSSTNDLASELASSCPAGTLVAAESQTAGRGRRGRTWHSPAGCGLLCSLIFRHAPDSLAPGIVTLLVAAAIARAVRYHCGLFVSVKWPNDLVVNTGSHSPQAPGDCAVVAKLGGVLCELRATTLVAGFGLNVNHRSFPPDLQHATSLYQQTGRTYNRNLLLKDIMRQLQADCDEAQALGSAPVLERSRSLSATLGHRVAVVTEAASINGRARDLASDGSLLVEGVDGTTHRVLSGDVVEPLVAGDEARRTAT